MTQQQADFYNMWYQLWMKQSKEFFESANENLQDFFTKGKIPDPKEHMAHIEKWLETLKAQWDFIQLTEEQKEYANYWKMMIKMCSEASDLMLKEWIARSTQGHPVKTIQELYELWLNSCQEVYAKSLRSKSFQETYADFMNTALRFWSGQVPK